MLNRLIKIMTLVITLSVIQSTSAVFFSGEVLKKDDITVVILGEFHNDITTNYAKIKEQRNDLLAFSKKNNAFIIAEDITGYTGSNEYIKNKVDKIAIIVEKYPFSAIAGLSKLCTQQNIPNMNAECRYMLAADAPLKLQLEVDKKFLDMLKTCIDNPIYQKYVQNVIEEYDFYVKQLLAKQSSRSFLQNLSSAASRQNEDFKIRTSLKMLDLNIICELNKILESKKYPIIIITVGVYHMQNISEMIQNIFNFKITLRKNLTREIRMFGPSQKMSDIGAKNLSILKEYALDLPKFFDEALKTPAIRSRM